MKKSSPSLFTTLIRNSLAAFGVFIVVFVLVFGVGFSLSRGRWQQQAADRITSVLGRELNLLVGQGDKLEGEAVNRALRGFLVSSVYVMVFHPDGTLIFWSGKGKSWYQEDNPAEEGMSRQTEAELLPYLPPADRPVRSMSLYSRLKAEGKLVPLVSRGVEVGAFYAGHQSFELIEENFQFMRSLLIALAGGLMVAGGAATVFAWRMFRQSSLRAARVEEGLTSIARGRRDVSFLPSGSRELEGIVEAALKLQQTLVQEQNLRRQWAQDIAHDLKTPLAGLKVQLEGLEEGVLEPGQNRIEILVGEVNRLEALTTNLLDLAKLESPGLRLVRSRCRLEDLAEPLADHFFPLAQQAGREWVWSVSPGEISIDHDLMHRALVNLLSNALNHASGPGNLEADWRVTGSGLRIAVSNPGRISPDDEPYLFHRLYRGEASRTPGGNGLGLVIAQAIVRLHGGTLTLANKGHDRVEAVVVLPHEQ